MSPEMYSALARIIYPVYTAGVQELRDISEIFSLWSSTKVMAEEIDELPDTVNRWRQRGRHPLPAALVLHRERRGHGVRGRPREAAEDVRAVRAPELRGARGQIDQRRDPREA